jgi:pyruvate formate-lyase/glycerol dehydratase family glycyl radical enzyme
MESLVNRIWGLEATTRIKKLKEQLLLTKPILCSQRAVIATKAYQETEGEPALIRRAKVIHRILSEITVRILNHELIVGLFTEEQRGAPVFPETGTFWLEKELDSRLESRPQDRFIVPGKVKKELREILPYWKGKTLFDFISGALPDEIKRVRRANIFTMDLHERGGLGHFIPDLPTILKKGIKDIQGEAFARLKDADLSKPEIYRKALFWKAAITTCEGIIAFAKRYAKEAERLTRGERDLRRKKELEIISETCDRVPEHPARTFREALQAVWFIQMLIHLELNSNAISPGRLDQILYPYLRDDLDEGRLDIEEAQELVDAFFIKFNEIIKVWDEEATHVHAGFPMVQNITLGGLNEANTGGSNSVTYLFLNAERHVHLPQPHTTIRVSEKTEDDLLRKGTEVIRLGGGKPQLISDPVVTSSLLMRGLTLKEARMSSCIGCVEYGAIGTWGRHNGGYFNLAKILELAIHNGVERLTGERVGLETGEPASFKSFKEVKQAYIKQLEYFIRLQVTEDNIIDMVHEQVMPHVLTSVLVPDCIENGKDVTSGGARYNWTGTLGVGLANLVDSLAAIKKVVFEDKKMTMRQLDSALNQNFEGAEKLRRLMLDAPKYGNDDDFVDLLMKEITDIYFDLVERHENHRGGRFVPGLFSLSSSLPFGWATGATPDGRKAKEPLAEGVSPSHGVDQEGPTAVLKSVSKMDCIRVTNGMILNQKFSPMLLEGETNTRKFVDMIKTYLIDLGGAHVQVNVVSSEMLRAAQEDPEKYRNLVIRVTGYSAFFTELSKEVQDDIIGRTEQMGFI